MPSGLTKSAPSSAIDVMIARQPIYTNQMGVFGYELLFRSPAQPDIDKNTSKATAHVLTHAMLSFNLDELVCNRNAVINVTREFIVHIGEIHLPAERIILDLPDDLQVDTQLAEQLEALKTSGFRLSFGGINNLTHLQPLLPLADIFRVDVLDIQDKPLDKLVKFLRTYKQLSLQALRVETIEQYRTYCDKGFDYLQGYFLSRPREYVNKDLPASKIAILSLLAVAHSPDTSLDDIESRISQDVALSYKLLKLINSPFFGVSHKVDSARQAIVLLGRDEICRWVSLIALSNMSDEPVAMMEIALLRARLCELLATRARLSNSGYFTVGMFSALDILMKQPIRQILAKLPLSDDVSGAILEHKGLLGEALVCALAVENAEWNEMQFGSLTHKDIVTAFREAIQWSNNLIGSL